MEYDIIEFKILDRHVLWVKCRDVVSGVIKFLPSKFRKVFACLSDVNNFNKVFLDSGALTWCLNNQVIDIAPDRVHDELIDEEIWELV